MSEKSRKWVKTFLPRFAPLVETGKKTTTIRPFPKRPQDMPKPGHLIDCRMWSGRPYHSKQLSLRTARITEIFAVNVTVAGIEFIGSATQRDTYDQIAIEDGFENWLAMLAWFAVKRGLPFRGIMIRWEVAP